MQEQNNNNNKMFIKPKVSIGALLVNARTHVALSQADVADQMNLSISTIKALETDDFDNLPEATFVRGYLRNYARAVNIDPDGIIQTYNEQFVVEEEETPVVVNTKQSVDAGIIWSTGAVMVILVGLVISWWFEGTETPIVATEVAQLQVSDTQNNVVEHPEHAIPFDLDESESTTVKEVLVDPSIKQKEEITEIAEVTEEVEQAMEAEVLQPNSLVTISNDGDLLTVTYVEQSWTEIQDADSKTLMQGLIEPGVVRNLRGRAPFQIFLGNSPGVIIEVNGQYIDHSRHNRRNRTARFEVSSGVFN